MNYGLLHEIISEFENFQNDSKESKNKSMHDFASFIQVKESLNSTIENIPVSNKSTQTDLEVGISRLLVHLYRYAKIHIRNAMTDFPELVSEDFTYLYTLYRYGCMTKTQLIVRNIHEKPTGLEVIKRLLNHKLITEAIDKSDKRSKLLTITKKGIKAYENTKDITTNVAKVVSGNLSTIEKQTLFQLLKKLDHYHNPIFLSKDTRSVNTLLNELSMN
jgi:MarR family transcriptional regulator, lower aerobic nicotinate degradation pathway regulator